MPNDLEELTDPLRRRLDELNLLRDRALNEGRQIIRFSANSIHAIHRRDFDEAKRLLDQAGSMLTALVADLEQSPNLRWAGYVQDAMKEYAEASILFAFIADRPLPAPEALGIDDAPYLNGLAEAASELRRSILDSLRSGDLERSERLLTAMDETYSLLITIDFPDGLTGGLRRTTDALRAVLERTRGDLTLTTIQNRLQKRIDRVLELQDPSQLEDQRS
jgi:translin